MAFISTRGITQIFGLVWIDYLADMGKLNIQHKLNTGKEKRIGKCDDSENNVVYEMDGCFFQ